MVRKIFLVHHTHMDIGYTDQPLHVLDQQLSFLDQAVAMGMANQEFHWTIESAYLLKDYCRNRQPEQVDRLMSLLKTGQFELGAFEVQPLTELMTAEELAESVGYAVNVGQREGFAVQTALLDDICGFAAGLPSALAAAGIRYLLCGAGAFQAFLPWANLPHFFYLEDKAKQRLLLYNLGINRTEIPQQARELIAVYGMAANFIFNPWRDYFAGKNPGQCPEDAFAQFARRLEQEKYPYEEVLLQYGGDNRWPLADLLDLIAKINAENKLPPLELTTPSHFMHFMEDKYGAAMPVCRGILTDPWITRVNPAPAPLKTFLAAQRRRLYLENLGRQADETIKENLALYADHTCGLCDWQVPELLKPEYSPNDQVFDCLRSSWRHKARYAEIADGLSTNALRHQLNTMSPSGLSVVNMSDQPQGGVVRLVLGRDAAPLTNLSLPGSQAVRWQPCAYHQYLVEVPQIPAGAFLQLQPEYGELPNLTSKPLMPVAALPEQLTSDNFQARLDKDGYIISLTTKDGRSFSRKSPLFAVKLQHPENYALSWEGAGMMPLQESSFPDPVIFSAALLNEGEVGWQWEQRGCFPGDLNFRMITSFYRHQPYLDVECFIDKPAHRRLESLYLSCHLLGTAKKWQIGQHTGNLDPAGELLPGAMKDLFLAPKGAWVQTADFTAFMQSFDAPVLHPGNPSLFAWNPDRTFDQEPATFHWNLYQNFLITDCPAWQPILESFHFRLYPEAPAACPPAPDSLAFINH